MTIHGRAPTASNPAETDGTAGADSALARNQAARRRRVLEAALRLAAEGGFAAVQMRDVAAEANVALGTVYRYFSSKERLLLEANIEQIRGLEERLRRRPPSGATAADRVVEVLRRANEALQRAPEVTGAMVRAIGQAAPAEADAVREVTGGMTAIILGAMGSEKPSEEELVVARTLQLTWFSGLIGWVGGVDPPGRVTTDLVAATRLLLGDHR